jgi:hypothetical protein
MLDTINKRYKLYLNNEHVDNLTNNIAERFMLKTKHMTN